MGFEMIIFEINEIVIDKKAGKVTIPVKTILEKLDKKGKTKIAFPAFLTKEEVEHEYSPKLSGINFRTWLSMNFEQNKTGKRTLNVYSKLLNDLADLAEKYGPADLNEAIDRCNRPETCTIPYLKAILRNMKIKQDEINKEVRYDNEKEESYQRSIENAVKRYM